MGARRLMVLGGMGIGVAIAQRLLWSIAAVQPGWTQIAPCSPPNPGEFGVLVRTPNRATQELVINALLPSNRTARVCQYQGEIVTHIRHLPDRATSDRWSQYIYENTGLQPFVLTSPGIPQSPAHLSPNLRADSEPLGTGFAVLVDYKNQPELARQVQNLLGTPVGWVTFEGKPYLLALSSRDQEEAAATLMSLSDRGFSVLLVNARQVRLLTPPQR